VTEPLRNEVYELADACLREDLSPQGFSRLEQLIRDDEQARRYFIEFVHDSFSLRTWAEAQAGPASEARSAVNGRTGSPKPWNDAAHALGEGCREQAIRNGIGGNGLAHKIPQPVSESAVRGLDCTGRSPHEGQPKDVAPPARLGPVRPARFGRWRWVAAAVAIALATLLWPIIRPRAPIATTRPPAVASPKDRTRDGFAVVVQLAGVAWEQGRVRQPAEGDILAAGRLAFRSGRAMLTFLSGVTLVVEGPADVDLVAVDRVFCRRGKLWAKVPRGAEGFVILAPGSAIVDQGTEFAVNVEADGRADVLVLEGKVEAALLDREGTPDYQLLIGERKAFALNRLTDRIEESAANSSAFAAPASVSVPPLILNEGYPKAVLASRPTAYWRFESMADGTIPNEVRGGPPLRATGPLQIAGTDHGNGCIVFAGAGAWQFLSLDGLRTPARDPGYTVELWVLPEGIQRATLVALFPPTEPGVQIAHPFLLELTDQRRQSLHKPASVRFLDRWPAATAGGLNVYSRDIYRPYRWHHIVAQKNGHRMELFVDGSLTQSILMDTNHLTMPCQLVVGQLSASRDYYEKRSFVGRIDEVALYDRPLSAQDVRHHYELALERSP
jgi:hypothetical protein